MKKRMKKRGSLFLAIFLLISLVLIAGVFFYYLYLPVEKSEVEDMTVMNVVDGDTFKYYNSERKRILTVRLLCVNTPEENEEGYEEAKAFLEGLIIGKQIILEKDVSETDRYGRLLRYAYLQNGTFVNKEIIKNGYGELLIIEPDVKRCSEMM